MPIKVMNAEQSEADVLCLLRKEAAMFLKAWVKESAYEFMKREASSKKPLETGGILVGYPHFKEQEVIITDVIGPGPKATHEEDLFMYDSEYVNKEIIRLFEESDGEKNFVGCWHTHPVGTGHLSNKDCFALTTSLSNTKPQPDFSIMGVLWNQTFGEEYWKLWLWYVRRNHAIERIKDVLTVYDTEKLFIPKGVA